VKYWTGALTRILANIAKDPFRPNQDRLDFSRKWLSAGYAYDQRPKLPSKHFLDLYPGAETLQVDLGAVNFRRSNATPMELYCMSCIAMLRNPRRIFEIGTFDGATALRLARCCPDAEVFTLDLGSENVSDDQAAVIGGEAANVRAGGVGSRFAQLPEASRIRQLLGDSTLFDFSPYAGTCDLIFVDACHDYEFAAADSRSALRLLRAGGVILWHDYIPGWPGVVKAIDELLPAYPIRHISGTALAVLDTSSQALHAENPAN